MGLIVEYLCLKDLVFPGREGGGGAGGGGGDQGEGRRRKSWKVGGITLFLEIRLPIFFWLSCPILF